MVEYGNGISQVSGQGGGGGTAAAGSVDVGANVGAMVGRTVNEIAALPPHILVLGAIAILFGLLVLKRAF